MFKSSKYFKYFLFILFFFFIFLLYLSIDQRCKVRNFILVIFHQNNTFDKKLSTKTNLSIYQKDYFLTNNNDLKFYDNLK